MNESLQLPNYIPTNNQSIHHLLAVFILIAGDHDAQSIETVACVYSRVKTFGAVSLHSPNGEP